MRLQYSLGFTVIDVMIAIAIVAILGATTMPIVHGYLTRGTLESTTQDIVAALRYAQIQSEAGVDDAAWGVFVGGGLITLFRGESYTTRASAYDQTVAYPSSTAITGTIEYVFTKRTGRTSSGTITLTSPSFLTQSIVVNAMGMIDF